MTVEGILVLGAGLAGLGFATELPGVTLLESSDSPGGHARSHEFGGFHFDEGAHICHSRDPEFISMIENASEDVAIKQRSNVRNYWHGEWTGYPIQNHLRDLSVEHRIEALTSLMTAQTTRDVQSTDTYENWCRAQYGDFITNNFYEEFTEKYWRCSSSELATDWLSGRLIPTDLATIVRGAFVADVPDQATFSTFRYPRNGGFFDFFAPLYDGLDVRTGERVVEIDLSKGQASTSSGSVFDFDQLASSIPLPVLVSIVKDVPDDIALAATHLHHTELLCVNIVTDEPGLSDLDWCYVYDEEIHPARLSFPHNLAQTNASGNRTAVQAEIFRNHREGWPNLDALQQETVDQVAKLLGLSRDSILDVGTTQTKYAYVVSDHRRAAATSMILEWLESRQVYCMGLYGRWNYLWSDRAYSSGVETARTMRRKL